MIVKDYTLTVDFDKGIKYPAMRFVKGDSQSCAFNFSIVQDITDLSLVVTFKLPDETPYIQGAEIKGPHEAYLMLPSDVLSQVGKVLCQVAIHNDGRLTNAVPFSYLVVEDFAEDGVIEASDNLPILAQLITECMDIIEAEELRVLAEALRVENEGDETKGRVKAEIDRVAAEELRASNEVERVSLYNNISNMLATGQLKGDKGDKGPKGDKPAHRWIDTSLQIENPDGTWGDAVNLKGDKGDQGEQGIQGPKGDKGDTGEPGTSLSLKVSRQYDTYEDLPVSADIGYMCLVGSELHIYTENGWVNAGKLTKIDYDLFMHIDGGLFTDESGVEIGESGLEALQNHIIDANTHANLIIDGMEV